MRPSRGEDCLVVHSLFGSVLVKVRVAPPAEKVSRLVGCLCTRLSLPDPGLLLSMSVVMLPFFSFVGAPARLLVRAVLWRGMPADTRRRPGVMSPPPAR